MKEAKYCGLGVPLLWFAVL